jgi:hypothetical protein
VIFFTTDGKPEPELNLRPLFEAYRGEVSRQGWSRKHLGGAGEFRRDTLAMLVVKIKRKSPQHPPQPVEFVLAGRRRRSDVTLFDELLGQAAETT